MPKLFGTNGIRGSASTLFSKQFCLEIGSVFGGWLKSKGKTGYVAVAMDPRDSSPRIKAGVCQGLASQGFEVLDEGVIPTPALTYFVKKSAHVAGGVMVTGSHVKADLNGVKLLIDGEEVNKSQETEIEALFGKALAGSNPIVKYENAARDLYLDMLTGMAELPYPKWKIIVDTANGTQTEIVKPLFAALGLELDCDNDIQSEYFVPRDTESYDSVTELSKKVLQAEADLGVAFDVDGDRVVFVDARGEFVPGDYSCSLIAKQFSGPIVTTVSTADVITGALRTRIGATYVIAKMKEVDSKFGFEPNGGGIFADNFYGRDGGATVIALLNILKASHTGLSQNLSTLPKYYLFKDKIDCPFDKYNLLFAAVKARFTDKNIDDTDGLKVSLNSDEWVLFRGSGNAPEFRVFVQSRDEHAAKSQGQKYLAWVSEQIKSSSTPSQSGLDSLGIEETINEFPDQISQVISDMSTLNVDSSLGLVNNIVLAGMGGSALGGRVVGSFKNSLKIPFEVVTGYDLPKYVSAKTLLILSSYSGGTAEVLSCAASGIAVGAKMFVIATGGKLAELAKAQKIDAYVFDPKFDPAEMPRMGVGYSIFAVLTLLLRLGLISNFSSVNSLSTWLKSQQPKVRELAQKIALELVGKHPIFLTSGHLLGSAHVTKNNLNENSKQIAYLFDLPEADHHLLEGLAFPTSLSADSVFLLFNSDLYSSTLQKQITVTVDVIAKHHIKLVQIDAVGSDQLEQSLYIVHLGQYLSLYLAHANGIDPGPIPWVDYIKDKL